MAKIALGKGLDALIPAREEKAEKTALRLLDIENIRTPHSQPRKIFSDTAIEELAESIREKGILQPLLVRRQNGSYELIAGERRLRAAQSIGLDEVPAIVMDSMSDLESYQLALIENIQREDLTPLEEAEAYSRLLNNGALSKEELSKKVGKNRSTIANSVRLLALPDRVKELINAGKISAGHARAILSVESEEKQIEIAEKIADSNLSVRTIEEMVYSTKPRKKRGRKLKLKRQPPEIYEAETRLKQHLQTSVKVKRGLKEGKIEISFYNEEDLSRLLDLITG